MTRTIQSKAPVRIDLGGGTVDIWPLYLLTRAPVTVNMAINLYAQVELTENTHASSPKVTLRSEDLGRMLEFDWADIDQINPPPELILHLKLLKHFLAKKTGKTQGSLTLTTRAQSPAGAGLGGSSALNIALTGALAAWAYGQPLSVKTEGEALIEIARDIESQVLNGPAGLQDYYAAMFGGLQQLHWGIGSHVRVSLASDILDQLQDRLLLFYSGKSRNSGINNWKIFKDLVDNHGGVQQKFSSINHSAQDLAMALGDKDWSRVEKAITDEWQTRQTLADGIMTPEINQAFQVAKEFNLPASRICGAGGGGCFAIFVPSGDDELKSKVSRQVVNDTVVSLPFRASARGLDVTMIKQ